MTSLLTGLYPSEHGLVDRVRGKRSKVVVGLDPSIPTLAEVLEARGVTTAAFMCANSNLKPMFGLTRGFSHSSWHSTTEGATIVGVFERWLEERPRRTFAYLHFMDVHNPLRTELIPSRLDRGLDLEVIRKSSDELLSQYAASVRRADGHIGRVLRALESRRELDESWVIVTADHGEELMDHGSMLAHGRTLYRELIHVPLVIRPPSGTARPSCIDQPVELIDVLPTILDCHGGATPEVRGKSLLPAVRGQADETRAAFSELTRKDRYSRSVTTRTHQLIESFALEEARVAAIEDLRPGASVEAQGQLMDGDRLLATKVSLKRDSRVNRIRGPIADFDPASGCLETMGLRFQIDPQTDLVGYDREAFRVDELTAGDQVSIEFLVEPVDVQRALKIKRRNRGGKAKVAGLIERVERLSPDLRLITVLGVEIAVPDSTRLTPMRSTRDRATDDDALTRVLNGDFVGVERELYDLRDDPGEKRDVGQVQPEVLRDLQARLATWTQSLNIRTQEAAQTVEVDPETMEQLRLMGYVE